MIFVTKFPGIEKPHWPLLSMVTVEKNIYLFFLPLLNQNMEDFVHSMNKMSRQRISPIFPVKTAKWIFSFIKIYPYSFIQNEHENRCLYIYSAKHPPPAPKNGDMHKHSIGWWQSFLSTDKSVFDKFSRLNFKSTNNFDKKLQHAESTERKYKFSASSEIRR